MLRPVQNLLVVSLLVQVAFVSCTASTGSNKTEGDEGLKDSVFKYVNGGDGKSHAAEILKCAGQQDFNCVLDKAQDLLIERHERLLAEADAQALATTGRKEGGTSAPSAIIDTISALVSEISEILFDKGGLGGFFRDSKEDKAEKDDKTAASDEDEDYDDDDEEEDDEEEDASTEVATAGRRASNKSFNDLESRGKKKKKKQKLKTIIKLLVLGAVLFFKISLLLKVLAAHLQIKFLLIAGAGLLINAARFYIDLKKGHNPQKVIYYEHAQHQHHYENEDEWGGTGGGGSPGGGGYWARAYDKDEKDEESSSPQSLAYRGQRPALHEPFSRGEETPSSSWFF